MIQYNKKLETLYSQESRKMEIKVFVLVDDIEQFDKLCSMPYDDKLSFEVLEDVDQLEDYNNPVIWDSRTLSKELEEAGYEIETIM